MSASGLGNESRYRCEDCFRTLVDHATDIITILDPDGLVLYESPAILPVLGYTPEELIGSDLFALIHTDDVTANKAFFERVVRKTGSSTAARFRFRHKDDSWRWFDVIVSNLLDDPAVRGVVINARDVTDRQRAEEQLHESEQHHRKLHAEAQRRAQDLALLSDVSSALATELELPDLFRTVVNGIARTFGYSLVSLYLLEHDVLVLQHQVGYAQQIERIPVSAGIAGRVVSTGNPLLITDVRTDPSFLAAIPGIVSEICVPVHDEGRVAGMLNLESMDEAPLTNDDLQLLVALSQNVGVAIGRARLYADVRRSEARSRALLEHAADMISVFDADSRRTYASPAYERILGFRPDELVGQPFSVICYPSDAVIIQQAFARFTQRSFATERFEVRVRHRDGSPRWLDIIAVNRLADPAVGGVVVTSRDITERKALETQLWHQAHHDELTAIPNRALLLDHLAQALSELDRRHEPEGVSLLFLDLDGFKVVNDTLGHDAGDRLLFAAAQRLADCLATDDLIARYGGDEFAVLLAPSTVQQDAVRVAQRLATALASPFDLNGHQVRITASSGIVSSPKLTETREVFRAADLALYRAKAAGKGTVAVFDPVRDGGALLRLSE